MNKDGNIRVESGFCGERLPLTEEELTGKTGFLSDEELRRARELKVWACVDLLLTRINKDGKVEVLLGYRQQKPQTGWWLSCGGGLSINAKKYPYGQTPKEGAHDKAKEELGLDINPGSFEDIGLFSTAFAEGGDSKGEGRCQTLNLAVTADLTRDNIEITLNKEHAESRWFLIDDITKDNEEEFPPILIQAAEKLKVILSRKLKYYGDYLKHLDGFKVPEGHVFVELQTKGIGNDELKNAKYQTEETVIHEEGTNIPGIDPFGDTSPFTKTEGILLASGESKEVEMYYWGRSFKVILKDNNGQVELDLPKELKEYLEEIRKEVERRLAKFAISSVGTETND